LFQLLFIREAPTDCESVAIREEGRSLPHREH